MTTANIVFSSTEAAPLFSHYQGQVNPQPAYVTLELQTGDVDAEADGNIGNSMPADVWHGLVIRFPIRSDLTTDQVKEVLTEFLPTAQKILDGAKIVWDGSNHVGRLTEDAQGLVDQISMGNPLGEDLESLVITGLAEWLANGGTDCWMPSESDDVDEYIREFDLDGYVTGEDVREVLADMWAEHLYSGEVLGQNVAQWLLDDGRCDDSAWTDELEAYAKGETPED